MTEPVEPTPYEARRQLAEHGRLDRLSSPEEVEAAVELLTSWWLAAQAFGVSVEDLAAVGSLPQTVTAAVSRARDSGRLRLPGTHRR